jgi:N-acetyl-anhydromuramyl-L-alanine amidase AmpD
MAASSPNKTRRREWVSWLCVHWTGGTYASAVDWCMRAESEVSYHVILGRAKGERADLVPWEYAAWSVGHAKPPAPWLAFRSGNHTSESIALAGGPPTPPTEWQRDELVRLLAERMRHHGWGAHDVHRILGHDQVAVFKPGHPRAGEFGRKPDPQGSGWLPLEPIRLAVAELLLPPRPNFFQLSGTALRKFWPF